MASVIAAAQGGAERIELCSALALGGVTPTIGMMKWIREQYPQLKIQVLIRSREGNFVYDKADLEAMLTDIRESLPYADGIVCGALTADGDIDVKALKLMVEASENKPFTFHRAFDRCRDAKQALEQIIETGCARILTSGQQPSAEQGIPLLRELVQQAANRLIIMPGGGVTTKNARLIIDQTGCKEIHGSFSAGSGVTSADDVKYVLSTIDG